MSLSADFLNLLMGATFSHVGGDLVFQADCPEGDLVGPTAEQLADAIEAAPLHIYQSFQTTDGEYAGVCLAFKNKDDAQAMAAALDPSFVIRNGRNQSVRLIYLVDSKGSSYDAMISELNQPDDGDEWFLAESDYPLPYSGYELTEEDDAAISAGDDLPIYPDHVVVNKFLSTFYDTPTEPKPTKDTDDKADTPTGLSAETWEMNDAVVYGDIPTDVLNLPIKISVGASQEEKTWTTTPEFKFGDFLKTTLSIHKAGKKNGQCFVTGAVADKRRVKNSVIGLYLLGLDVDSGASLEKTFQKVRELGLCAVFYTTHSHLATELRIKQDKFYKWATDNGYEADATTELVRKFLQEDGKYVDDVVNSAEYVETIHDSTGVNLIIATRPIDKFRIIFPLSAPYIIAEQKMAQRDAILHWENMIMGMGAELGIQVDRAARDPSRLFFLPRHQQGAKFRILINGGRALDWKNIKAINSKEKLSSDPFDQAAAVMGGRMRGRPMSPTKGIDLMTWAAERADGFEISAVFKDYCDDRLREETAPGKYTCECPFDEDHSNAGDPDDKGCFVQDAGSNAETFTFRCSHDSCSGRDRLKMLEKCFNENWFPDSVLTDPRYDCLVREEEQEETTEEKEAAPEEAEEKKDKKNSVELYDRAHTLAEAATPGMQTEQIENILKLCIELSQFDRDRVLTTLGKKINVAKNQMMALFKVVESRESTNGTVDDAVYDPDKVAGDIKKRFASLKKSKKPLVVIDEGQQIPTVNHFIKVLSKLNRGTKASRRETREGIEEIEAVPGKHILFRYGDAPVRIDRSEDGTFKPEVLSKDIVASIAKDYIDVVKVTDSTAFEPVVLPEWVSRLAVVDPQLNLLPLDGFATLPYYTHNRQLITDVGYNEYSKKILRMQEDVAAILTNDQRKLIKHAPTIEDVDDAISELFGYCFADFPFYDGEEIENGQSSKAHLLCMMLHPIVRDLIDGPTPLYLVDKPSAGTGASLLVGSAMNIATGNKVGTTALSENEDEVRKAVSANFNVGKQVIFFDNVNFKLSSGFFANLATASRWEDRLLGGSDIISIKNTMQAIFAGNNVEASEENMRRMLLIKLDFKDDPTTADRTFKVSNLEKYVEENKTDLFCCLLTLVNYWISQGAIVWDGKPLTGFESYCQIMGGILKACEVPGFLENRALSSSANSPDKLAWNGFIQELISKHGFGKYVTMSEIAMTYTQMSNQPILAVNGGGRVIPSDDESRVYAPMQRVMDKQVNQIFRVYFKGEEKKVSIRKIIDREKSTTVYGIEMVEDRKQAA